MKEKQPARAGGDFKKILHDAKLKSTGPRLAVLKALRDVKHPETAQEIRKRLKNIDLVTLYRTLASFEEKQLVKRVDLHRDAVCYEFNTGHHHHIVCINCGTVEDFEVCDKNRLIKNIVAKASKFRNVSEHSLELFGVCNTCEKN